MTADIVVQIVAVALANGMVVYGFMRTDRKKQDAKMEQILISVSQIPALVATTEKNTRDIGTWARRHERLLGRLEGRGVIPSEEEC